MGLPHSSSLRWCSRLTRGRDFQVARQSGRNIRGEHLDLWVLPATLGPSRVGFIVPKYHQSGVERNRLKRQLREIARSEFLPSEPSIEVVIRARPSAYSCSFQQLLKQIQGFKTRISA